jgi:hypothetical protein
MSWATIGIWLLRSQNLATVVSAGQTLAEAANKLVNRFPIKRKASDATPQADPEPPHSDSPIRDVMRRLDAAESGLSEQARLMSSTARELGDIARVLQLLSVRTNVALALGIGALVLWGVTCAVLIMRLR